jgi:hypothetical protein
MMKATAKREGDEFTKFAAFMKRLVTVLHSEIKTQPDPEKAANKRKRTSRARASAG